MIQRDVPLMMSHRSAYAMPLMMSCVSYGSAYAMPHGPATFSAWPATLSAGPDMVSTLPEMVKVSRYSAL